MKSLADIPLDSRSLGVSCWLVAIIVSMCGSLACDTPPAVRRVVGTLERDRIELIAEAQEPIVEILVREGQQVQTGDLLVRLDESRFAAQHAQAQAARDRVKAAGRRGWIVQADLSLTDEAHNAVRQAIASAGQLNILVNNAGVEKHAAFWEVTEEDYDTVMHLNLKGVFFATQTMVKHLMAAQQPGKIINISSVHEDLPFPGFAPYCVSKGGVRMLTRTLAVELGPYGITVNAIAPGAIQTPINRDLLNDPPKLHTLLGQIPLKRLGHPHEVAGLTAFLASPDADYITGATYVVDGGLTWHYEER